VGGWPGHSGAVGLQSFGLAFPLIIVRLLDSVTQIKSDGPLNMLAGMLIGIFLLQAAFNFLQSYLLAYIGERIVYDLRTSLYTRLQNLSLDFYAVRRVGDLVSRLSSDVTQMRTMLTTTITSFLSQVLMLVGSVAILLTLNARFTLFILALLPVVMLVAFVFGSRIQKAARGYRTSWPTRRSSPKKGCRASVSSRALDAKPTKYGVTTPPWTKPFSPPCEWRC